MDLVFVLLIVALYVSTRGLVWAVSRLSGRERPGDLQ
jgi:hypothetical protein